MSLAGTLAAGGMRPASFLPTIKCSSCGHDIEISAMGDHECQPAPGSSNTGHVATDSSLAEKAPESLKPGNTTTSNPFALRPVNPNSFQPAQPSPLQFDSPPPVPMRTPSPGSAPQIRQRAPTLGSDQPSQRMPRPALPRINADMANQPFLAPFPHETTPISPAASSRSGSSLSNKPPPPLRSMTSPMPRLWDPRPPSPELSANLDCAFPPFPISASSSRRPSTSSGRKTPNSERGPSRSSSRQGHRLAEISNAETRSPVGSTPSGRRPSNDDRLQQDPMPFDRRRPSSPEALADYLPPLPPLSKIESFQQQESPKAEPSQFESNDTSILPSTSYNDRKAPPARPARPTESLTPSLLDKLRADPVASISAFPEPPLPLSPARSNTFPLERDKDSPDTLPSLTKVHSEPASNGNEQRPPPLATQSEPSDVPQAFPVRGVSKNEARMDYRLQDAPPVPQPAQLPELPVPKSIQLHRSGSFHRPSGSESSSASSSNSLRMTNSSGPSPVTSAASSMDAFSLLAQEISRENDDNSLRVAGLNVKSHVDPGMRAEQPKAKSPPRNFARPAPLKDVPSFEESPIIPSGSWPLESESPMDPAMKNGRLGDTQQESPPSSTADDASTADTGLNLNLDLSPAAFLSDEYDPYRAYTPQAKVEQPPQKPHDSGSYFKAYNPNSPSRSQTVKPPAPPAQPRHGRARSKTDSSRIDSIRTLHPPPMPQSPPSSQPQMQLSRRPTIGGRTNCRGCGHLIEGKSIKAADGGLTGRWHKACFVCKTCEHPFPNADFYVLNNQPYCEQHYHEKNRSLCFGCRKGIEGQYLETKTQDQRGLVMRKYHPKCLSCLTCKKTLPDDYFDFKGGVYCEMHAMASMRAVPRRGGGPGGSMTSRSGGPGLSPLKNSERAEKRSTKVMTMK